MAAEPAYSIAVEDHEIVVRLRQDVLNSEEVSRFLDYLELESVRRRSELSEEEAAALAQEIDGSAWERNRSRVQGRL